MKKSSKRDEDIGWIREHLNDVKLCNESEPADAVIASMADEIIDFSIGIENITIRSGMNQSSHA